MRAMAALVSTIPARKFWMLVLGTGLLLRLGAVLYFGDLRSPQLYETGGIARHLVAGKGYSTVFPILHADYGHVPRVYEDATPSAFTLPGFVLVAAGVFYLVGENSIAYVLLYLLNVTAGLLAVVFISRAAGVLLGEGVARWTAVLTALYPGVVVSVATFGGTPWYHLTMGLALWMFVRVPRNSSGTGAAVLAGLAAGMWTMFRAEGFAASILLLFWLGWRSEWRRSAIAFAMLIVVCAPWALRNTAALGSFVPFTTNVWLNAWRGNHPEASGGSFKATGGANWLTPELRSEIEALPRDRGYELAVMDVYRRETLNFIKADPLRATGLYARKLLMFLSIDWSDKRARSPLYWVPHALLSIGACIGAWLLFRRRIDALPLLLIIGLNAVVVSALHIESRYQMVLAPLYIIPCAYAVHTWFRQQTEDTPANGTTMKGIQA
ncbi:MAG: hypothetical protein M5R41_13160 [Bacteroidia bacterium]|nr:hypothetical protein [Bacteroidia bacterium]